ncbi:SSI family serine proteinase inhibitor [Streptomyces sp. NPDC048604]|uniref:SSI family serine proteinase inhibitor n=1 Tax=Streptomyces sp. NPDC048604 TaxID=3365578 RepID=UPI003712D6CB
MLRRLVLTTATAALALSAAPAAGALPVLSGLPPLPLLSSTPDRLTVTVSKSADPAANGTFELECGAAGASGNHPAAEDACARLGQLDRAGGDPFAAPADGRMCTMQHGGPAVARITGTWQGRSVDARFSRTDGCEIARWQNLEPVLPSVRR